MMESVRAEVSLEDVGTEKRKLNLGINFLKRIAPFHLRSVGQSNTLSSIFFEYTRPNQWRQQLSNDPYRIKKDAIKNISVRFALMSEEGTLRKEI